MCSLHFTDLPPVAEAACCFMISNCFLISVPYKQLSWPVCFLVFLISLVNIIRRDFCSDAASWLEEDTKVLSNLWCDCHVLQQGNGFGRSSQICAGIKPCWGDEYQWGSNGQPFSAGSLLKTRINLAAVCEVREVVRDFQDVPFFKGRKCSAASGRCPISAASADNSGGSHLLHMISVEQETCHYLLVQGGDWRDAAGGAPGVPGDEVPGAGLGGGTDTGEELGLDSNNLPKAGPGISLEKWWWSWSCSQAPLEIVMAHLPAGQSKLLY